MAPDSYACSHCGKNHSTVEFSFAADFPDTYANLTKEERDTRAIVATDQCIIDQEQFYVRGCIELPVRNSEAAFLWGLWARVHERDYDEIEEYWEFEGKDNRIGPYKGRLANSLELYPETLNMKLEIKIQPVGTRPLFYLLDKEHPMALEQETGLTRQKAEEYACLLLRMQKL
jgi:hypothetical protein